MRTSGSSLGRVWGGTGLRWGSGQQGGEREEGEARGQLADFGGKLTKAATGHFCSAPLDRWSRGGGGGYRLLLGSSVGPWVPSL